MARTRKDSKIDTRSARAKLAPKKAPYCTTLEPGRYLGYRKPRSGQAGSWVARYYDAGTRKFIERVVGTADDFVEADGELVLDWAQAQRKARPWYEHAHQTVTGETVRRGTMTVRGAWEAYWPAALRRGLKSKTRTEGAARLHILPALGDIPLEKLTKARLEKWLDELATAPYVPPPRKRPRKLKEGEEAPLPVVPRTEDELRARKVSANRVLKVLRAALNFVRDEGLVHVADDAWRRLEPFKDVDKARDRFLSPEEQVRLVNGAEPDFRLLIQGALLTGARFSELARMRVKDFNPVAAGGRGTVYVLPGKVHGRDRHVALTPEGKGFFEELVAGRDAEAPMFLKAGYEERGFKAPKTLRAWRSAEQWRPMQAALEAAGLEKMVFHELRHTYASMLVNLGVPLAFVSEQLGHANTRMVEKHYGHLCPSAKAEAIAKLVPATGIHQAGNVTALQVGRMRVG